MGRIQIFAGKGQGKSSAALGKAVLAAASGQRVVIIQFLKGNGLNESQFQRRLEPEIKIFRFEKSDCLFQELTEEKQTEEVRNIRNGFHFARKVLCTGECDLLVLDEVLGLVENGIVEEAELKSILETRSLHTDIILTGTELSDGIAQMADSISNVERIR